MDPRTKILHTAMELATQKGISHLTVDNVAAAAGLSKGGVFYHFKNKEELLSSMVAQIILEFKRECQGLESQGLTTVEAAIESSFAETQQQINRISALLAACAYDKNIGAQFQAEYEGWLDAMVAGGVSRATARLVATAIDGYYVAQALGVGAMDQEEKLALKKRLLMLARPTEEEILYRMFKEALNREETQVEAGVN